ncbi:hypothetical protein OH77DRAFT_522617 [Trametes cingulata]|nr:hypothetical protein OH77DRAFT_522617 [Trametes cingulata]
MSVTTTYHLRPVSAIARSASPTTSSSTTSDRSPPPLSVHTHAHRHAKASFLPPATASFSPIPTSARPRRPLSPTSLRDVDPPLDPERAFAARGKFPAPPTGHELMALFPPAPPPIRPGPTSGYFQHEERKFFAQAGKEIVRVRLEIDTPANGAHPPTPTGPGVPGVASPTQGLPNPHAHGRHPHPHSHPHQHQHPHPHAHRHDRQASGPSPGLPPPPPPPHSTSPRSHLPPGPGFPVASSQGPPPALGGPGAPAHPGYPVHSPPSISGRPTEPERIPRGVGGGAGDAMVVEEDDERWRHPTPHNERRRAGKHTRRVIVK